MLSAKDARGKHNINLFVSGDLKNRIKKVADRHHRTVSDLTRQVIVIGLRLFEAFSDAEAEAFEELLRVTKSRQRLRLLRDSGSDLLHHDSAGDK